MASRTSKTPLIRFLGIRYFSVCFVLLFLTNWHNVLAQDYCFTTSGGNSVSQMISPTPHIPCSDVSNTNFYVRVKLHIIRRSNGTGGQSQEVAENALSIITDHLDDHGIFLTAECSQINYVDDDSFYQTVVPDPCQLFVGYAGPEQIDIFIDAADASTAGGSAGEIPSTEIVLGGIWDHPLHQPATAVVNQLLLSMK